MKNPADKFPTRTHGKYTTYLDGCRCWPCIVDHSAYGMDLRRRRAAALAADPTLRPHGRRSTYTAWGCRCEPCRAANYAYAVAYRAKRAAS